MIADEDLPKWVHGSMPGISCVRYCKDSRNVVFAGADGFVLAKVINDRDGKKIVGEYKAVHHHDGAVTCIAMHPEDALFCTSGEDKNVCKFQLPDCEFVGNMTTFQTPVMSLAYNSEGTVLAAGSDGGVIRLIMNSNPMNGASVLEGHKDWVKGMVFCPEQERNLMASVSADGSMIIWNTSQGKAVKTLSILDKTNNKNHSNMRGIDWSSDGKFVAVSAATKIVLVDGETFNVVKELENNDCLRCVAVAFSVNNMYVAAAYQRKVAVWDIDKKELIASIPTGVFNVLSLQWHPSNNDLIMINSDGQVGIWETVVPSGHTHPAVAKKASEAAVVEADAKGMVDDEAGEDDVDEEAELRMKAAPADFSMELDEKEEAEMAARVLETEKLLERKRVEGGLENILDPEILGKSVQAPSVGLAKLPDYITAPQEPFQSSVSPLDAKRRYMCWNLLGMITSRDDGSGRSIDVEYHNSEQYKPARITDFVGYTIGALGKNGAFFSAPSTANRPASLMYRSFEGWASDTTWSVALGVIPDNSTAPSVLDGEECVSIAVGDGWCAAATNKSMIRVFSQTGVQKMILSIPGPIVTVAGSSETLLIVYHSGLGLNNTQSLGYWLYNVTRGELEGGWRGGWRGLLEWGVGWGTGGVGAGRGGSGQLALSPGSSLLWAGFSEDNIPTTVDSSMIVRQWISGLDGVWVPVGDIGPNRFSKTESVWIIGVTVTRQIYCVILKSTEKAPSIIPRPVVSTFPLTMPAGLSENVSKDLELAYMDQTLVHRSAEYSSVLERLMSDADVEDDSIPQKVLESQVKLDAALVKLIDAAIRADRSMRALDLFSLLGLRKSHDIAIKLASHSRKNALEDRMRILLSRKFAADEVLCSATVISPAPNAFIGRMSTVPPLRVDQPIEGASVPNLDPAPAYVNPPATKSAPKLMPFSETNVIPKDAKKKLQEAKGKEKKSKKPAKKEEQEPENKDPKEAQETKPQEKVQEEKEILQQNGNEKPIDVEAIPDEEKEKKSKKKSKKNAAQMPVASSPAQADGHPINPFARTEVPAGPIALESADAVIQCLDESSPAGPAAVSKGAKVAKNKKRDKPSSAPTKPNPFLDKFKKKPKADDAKKDEAPNTVEKEPQVVSVTEKLQPEQVSEKLDEKANVEMADDSKAL